MRASFPQASFVIWGVQKLTTTPTTIILSSYLGIRVDIVHQIGLDDAEVHVPFNNLQKER